MKYDIAGLVSVMTSCAQSTKSKFSAKSSCSAEKRKINGANAEKENQPYNRVNLLSPSFKCLLF